MLDIEKLKEYEGKKVFIRVEGEKERAYSGYVKEVLDLGNDLIFIGISRCDNGLFVSIQLKKIIEIKEEQ